MGCLRSTIRLTIALLFAPIGSLTLDWAYLVWTAFQIGLLVWVCAVLWRHLASEGVDPVERRLLISAALALPFVGTTLLLGSFSSLMLLCVLQFALALRRGKDASVRYGLC